MIMVRNGYGWAATDSKAPDSMIEIEGDKIIVDNNANVTGIGAGLCNDTSSSIHGSPFHPGLLLSQRFLTLLRQGVFARRSVGFSRFLSSQRGLLVIFSWNTSLSLEAKISTDLFSTLARFHSDLSIPAPEFRQLRLLFARCRLIHRYFLD
jgi:hypothetical protein